MLSHVVDALGELNEVVVYVGGAVVQLYSDNRDVPDPVTTSDVDCVINITTYTEFRKFEELLFAKHFRNDTEEGAPICRYLYEGQQVDFTPKVDTSIGKSNSGYLSGVAKRQSYSLGQGRTIFILPLAFYLASKLEALHSRGGEDYRGAKDFEDIVFVLNTCSTVVEQICSALDAEVLEFLKHEFSALCDRENIREEVLCALPNEDRIDHVLSVLQSIPQAL